MEQFASEPSLCARFSSDFRRETKDRFVATEDIYFALKSGRIIIDINTIKIIIWEKILWEINERCA